MGLALSAAGQTADNGTLFPYPQVPDNIEDFTERADYYVSHFWDECRLKTEYSSRQRFAEAFDDFAAMLPHASASVARQAVDNLIAKTTKASKDNLLPLVQVAEEALYDGGAGYVSDELYLPFAQAAASSKKMSSADKARYIHHARVLSGSQIDAKAPAFKYMAAQGAKASFATRPGVHTLLFINDPECDDCRMARVRLAADYYIKQFVNSGQLQVFSIYPGEYSAEWAEETLAASGDNWIIGAAPDIDELYDMRTSPTIYYLDREGNILAKTDDINAILEGFYNVYSRQQQ